MKCEANEICLIEKGKRACSDKCLWRRFITINFLGNNNED